MSEEKNEKLKAASADVEANADNTNSGQAGGEQDTSVEDAGTQAHKSENENRNEDEAEVEGSENPESIESLQAALVEAESRLRDETLRAQAEIQNIRRRAERDVANAHKFGQEKLIKELLAVVDSLERGIQTVDEQEGELEGTAKTLRDGSELTLKMFLDVLAKFQVKQIDPVGEPFDPQFHEAMSMVESPDAEPNSVIAVMQKGFTLNERLVRPAMVVVSKAKN